MWNHLRTAEPLRFISGYLRLFLLSMLLVACSEIRLVGAYDEVTDLGIQQVQGEVSSLFVTLEKNILTNDLQSNSYNNFKNTYNQIDGQIESLQIRCGALPKYNQVLKQVNLLDSNMHLMEKFHRSAGITDTLTIGLLKRTMVVSFRSMIVVQNALKREKIK
ncbi:hypothetical protein GS399_02450 [Pedobacter sp. HMF7647]|uniref:Uncharacterized protein n=1 Tax=Hufsiella arboris TaxID=2695275 RepID=A0A7K1Y5F1_9SPHI|nr:hypothetical protein [Hufsiella arboris]MXV49815.1 hypothetical protein [Hufsiella arboris]